MQASHRQNETRFGELNARYRIAWRPFSQEVRRWQALQATGEQGAPGLGVAEAAMRIAEAQYKQARNAFTDYLLKHCCRERETALVGSR